MRALDTINASLIIVSLYSKDGFETGAILRHEDDIFNAIKRFIPNPWKLRRYSLPDLPKIMQQGVKMPCRRMIRRRDKKNKNRRFFDSAPKALHNNATINL
ncbi:hypothetical protein N9Z39_00640 [Alphaproteobacteria bacterium]|nr:hypothetical protein [Alphaproteobacteria bacterium]